MKTLMVEFTGTPEAGKTTCIRNIIPRLEEKGLSVTCIQESAEIIPKGFPKGGFDTHLWMRFHSLEQILSQRYSQSDILLIDRGLIDGIFYTYEFYSRNPEEENHCFNFIRFLHQLDFLFPDFLFVFTVKPDIAIDRRGGEGRLVTLNFVKSYNNLLTSFVPSITVPHAVINSSELSKEELTEIVCHKIEILIKNNLS